MFLLLALLLGHSHGPNTPDTKPAVEPTATTEDIWAARCKGCHKADGTGNKEKKVPDLTSAAWQSKHEDADIKTTIENGVADTKMHAYKTKMTSEQVDGLVTFIRSFRK
jgi:mono/diheme cytochrome c family protein